MKLAAQDVFQPTTLPERTYVDRKNDKQETFSEILQKALRTKGRLISLAGASKSGKTVLCYKSVGADKLVDISGAQIQSTDDFWLRIAEKLNLPEETTNASAKTTSASTEARLTGNAGIGIASLGSNLASLETKTKSDSTTERSLRSNNSVMDIMRDCDNVLMIDDFHYIPRETQMYISRVLKTELFKGLKAIIISLPHRADEAVNCNPDLIGRTFFLEITPWRKEELKEIATKGFDLLNVNILNSYIEYLADESTISPQLMQENCLNLAFIAENKPLRVISKNDIEQAFNETARNYASIYKNVVAAISNGPSQGAKRRHSYQLKDSSECEIYPLLLKALALTPPQVVFSTDEVVRRIRSLLPDSGKQPTRLMIQNSVNQIIKIAGGLQRGMEIIDKRESTIYLLDAFFLFYLRWSG